MSIILDTNIACRVLIIDDDPDFCDLHKCICFDNGLVKMKIVYGGKLTDEYIRNNEIRKKILSLDRAGRAIIIDDNEVEKETNNVNNLNICLSDDEHVIALARVGKVRLLSTNDKNLQKDFNNKGLVDKPRGKIYKSNKHNHLLNRFCD